MTWIIFKKGWRITLKFSDNGREKEMNFWAMAVLLNAKRYRDSKYEHTEWNSYYNSSQKYCYLLASKKLPSLNHKAVAHKFSPCCQRISNCTEQSMLRTPDFGIRTFVSLTHICVIPATTPQNSIKENYCTFVFSAQPPQPWLKYSLIFLNRFEAVADTTVRVANVRKFARPHWAPRKESLF